MKYIADAPGVPKPADGFCGVTSDAYPDVPGSGAMLDIDVTVTWDDDPTAGEERNNLGPGTYNVLIEDCFCVELQILFFLEVGRKVKGLLSRCPTFEQSS